MTAIHLAMSVPRAAGTSFTPRSDNFNRTNAATLGTPSDSGSAWADLVAGLKITNNLATHEVAGTMALAVLETNGADHQVTSTPGITASGFEYEVGPNATYAQVLVLRAVDANNYVRVEYYGSGSGVMVKRIAGVETNMWFDNSNSAGWTRNGGTMQMRAKVVGQAVSVYYNQAGSGYTLITSQTLGAGELTSGTKAGIGIYVASNPGFWMTQDDLAIVLAT